MRQGVPDNEIKRRLQNLRNYERLYPRLKTKYAKLKKEFKQQTAENNMKQLAIIEPRLLELKF